MNKNGIIIINFFVVNCISDKVLIKPPLTFFVCQKFQLPHSKQIFNLDRSINILNVDWRGE